MRRLTHISTQGGTNSHFVKQYYLRLSLGLENWIDYKENGVLKVFILLYSKIFNFIKMKYIY
jgi:hypothetical protein